MALAERKKYTPEEYLALEEKAEFRSEYDGGEILAMAGSSLNHARIISNISRAFGNKLGEGCESVTTDIKVQIENSKKFYYPDVLIICGKPEFYQNRRDTIENPILIAEVLSGSTEARDRGEKFAAYQELESLQEYILISQDKAKIEQFSRQNDGSWKYQATIGLKSEVRFSSVNVNLTLDEIYQRVELD